VGGAVGIGVLVVKLTNIVIYGCKYFSNTALGVSSKFWCIVFFATIQ
jgi:hypothetical protein